MEINKLAAILFSAVFVNNLVFSRFLGLCPFFGVSKKLGPAVGVGGAVTFVMVMSTLAVYPLQYFVLLPWHLDRFLQITVFIFVIAALVQILEVSLKKFTPALHQALGVYLPMVTTNCAVLGTAFIAVSEKYNLAECAVFSFAAGSGFTLALVMMASVRERLDRAKVPSPFRDLPISFITAALMALAMNGFIGIVK